LSEGASAISEQNRKKYYSKWKKFML